MSKSTVEFDLTPLDNMRMALAKQPHVKIGLLGDGVRNQGDITNPEVGAANELGSISRNIPPRSFLRMPIQYKSKEIVAFTGSKKMMGLIASGKVKEALALLGIFAETIIHQAFASRGFGQWQANKPSTIDRKGSSAPLIDTRQMERAITSEVSK